MSEKTIVDQPRGVRDGEELPLDALTPWLQNALPELKGQPAVRQFSGGASNWTYQLDFENRSVILRRAPRGTKARGAHDMLREYRLQQALAPVFPLVPKMLAACEDRAVIGTEFYVMERCDGIILRRNLPDRLRLDASQVRQLCQNALDALVALHEVDINATGLAAIGKGAGYVQRQVGGWCTRYRNARTWNVPRAEKVMEWLQANLPEQETLCMTHNDFRFDNLVLAPADPTRIIAVLDWELATIGDPLMDLGNSLAYWVQADDDFVAQQTRRQPTHIPGMFTRDEAIEYYLARRGLKRVDTRFYEVFGLFRLVGIIQQIYFRYQRGQTRNPAFRHFWFFVHYLLWRCRRLIRSA